MEKKIRIILERARDGVEPLEDLEQELLNLHSVMSRLKNELNRLIVDSEKEYNKNIDLGFKTAARTNNNFSCAYQIVLDLIKHYET